MSLRTNLLPIIAIVFSSLLPLGAAEAIEPDYMTAMGIVQFSGDIEAPNFVLPTAHGKMLQLHDFKGNVILLNFWASW